MVDILKMVVHLGPFKGWKTLIGALLMGASKVVPPPYQPILWVLGEVAVAWGGTSIVAEKTGILPSNQFKD